MDKQRSLYLELQGKKLRYSLQCGVFQQSFTWSVASLLAVAEFCYWISVFGAAAELLDNLFNNNNINNNNNNNIYLLQLICYPVAVVFYM